MKSILFLSLALALSFPAANAATPPASPRLPNIVVIMADDLGWGDLSCQPQETERPDIPVSTPNIDRLAKTGVRCTNAYATAPVCAPSRAGLLTGRYQQRVGFYEFVDCEAGLPAQEKLLPEVLGANGYATGLIGKWHVGHPPGCRPLDRGFQRFFGFIGGQHDYYNPLLGETVTGMSFDYSSPVFDQTEPVKSEEYLTESFTNQAIDFVEKQAAKEKPFFLYLAYNAPHPPLQATWEKLEPYAQKRKNGRANERDLARAMIESLDDGVGKLTARLRELGLEENTLVIFTSDNGGHDDGPGGALAQHNGGLRPRKGLLWEGGIRIPFILNWPGKLPASKVYDQPVSHLDIFPTAMALAEIQPAPKQLDGVNLLPFLNGANPESPHPVLHWGFTASVPRWAVRKGPWKLTNDFANGSSKTPVMELHNLETDLKEAVDVADQHPEIVAELKALRVEFVASHAPQLCTPALFAQWKEELKRLKTALPNPDALRCDGAPGHWKR